MNSVLEIENALRQMSPEVRWEVARRRRIFRWKVMPNMVLAARAEESW